MSANSGSTFWVAAWKGLPFRHDVPGLHQMALVVLNVGGPAGMLRVICVKLRLEPVPGLQKGLVVVQERPAGGAAHRRQHRGELLEHLVRSVLRPGDYSGNRAVQVVVYVQPGDPCHPLFLFPGIVGLVNTQEYTPSWSILKGAVTRVFQFSTLGEYRPRPRVIPNGAKRPACRSIGAGRSEESKCRLTRTGIEAVQPITRPRSARTLTPRSARGDNRMTLGRPRRHREPHPVPPGRQDRCQRR